MKIIPHHTSNKQFRENAHVIWWENGKFKKKKKTKTRRSETLEVGDQKANYM